MVDPPALRQVLTIEREWYSCSGVRGRQVPRGLSTQRLWGYHLYQGCTSGQGQKMGIGVCAVRSRCHSESVVQLMWIVCKFTIDCISLFSVHPRRCSCQIRWIPVYTSTSNRHPPDVPECRNCRFAVWLIATAGAQRPECPVPQATYPQASLPNFVPERR